MWHLKPDDLLAAYDWKKDVHHEECHRGNQESIHNWVDRIWCTLQSHNVRSKQNKQQGECLKALPVARVKTPAREQLSLHGRL